MEFENNREKVVTIVNSLTQSPSLHTQISDSIPFNYTVKHIFGLVRGSENNSTR